VLARLRLNAFFSGNNQQNQVNPAYTGEHVADETLVPGDIHESEAEVLATCAGKLEVGETEVNGDPSSLLFFQPIGVNSGKRLDQRRFPVINVAGRANNDGFHRSPVYAWQELLTAEHPEC
jgi:hypothetical protein